MIPYYRMSRYVEDTLNSALAQTYGRLEIVIVNDGSFERDDRVMVATRREI